MNDLPQTERRNPRTGALDRLPTCELVELLAREQSEAVPAVVGISGELAAAVDEIAMRLNSGGALHYVGAGSSGRLAFVDASEMPPTFGTEPALVCAHIAGGRDALTRAIEGAEDDGDAGEREMRGHVKSGDAVVGLSASGAAAFVIRAIETARETGAWTLGVSNNRGSPLAAAADLARARAEAAAARRGAELSILHSPINGVVTRLNAAMGASVDPSQVLIEIADPTALDVLFSVTPTDAGRIHPGARVTLSAGQDAAGEPLGVGAVVDVAGTVDSLTRSVAVRVQAPTTRRPMRIGETVYGLIAVAVNPAAIVVPIEALVPEGDGFKVFVVDASGMAHEREVTVGGRTDKVAEITDGLAAGERVATQGAYGLEDSVKVVPLKPSDSTAKKPPETP